MIVGDANVSQTRQVNRIDGTTGDKFFWDNLPTHILVTENGVTVHKEVSYRVVEHGVPYGYEVEGVGTEELTNVFQLTEISVRKEWDDQNDYYGIRPDSVKVTLQSSPDGSTWSNVADGSGKVLTLVLTAEANYEGKFEELPVYDMSGNELTYRIVEAEEDLPVGYEQLTPVVTTGEDGNALCVLTNRMLTVNVAGVKIWDDFDNLYGLRPEEIQLTVLNNGKPVDPQPVITFAEDWTYTISGLPEMLPDANGNLDPAVYTIVEAPVPGYNPTLTISGILNEAEGLITMEDLVNELTVMLEIDNITENGAHPDRTNVGGFVSVQNHAVTNRDIDPWMERATYVTWMVEENWEFADGIIAPSGRSASCCPQWP